MTYRTRERCGGRYSRKEGRKEEKMRVITRYVSSDGEHQVTTEGEGQNGEAGGGEKNVR